MCSQISANVDENYPGANFHQLIGSKCKYTVLKSSVSPTKEEYTTRSTSFTLETLNQVLERSA